MVKRYISIFLIVMFSVFAGNKSQECRKKSINEVTYEELVEVYGLGKVKAIEILKERSVNGNFKNKKDFANRIVKTGDLVLNRLEQKYKF